MEGAMLPDQDWRVVEDFQNYSVSHLGLVQNNRNGRLIVPRYTQRGLPYVGLYVSGQQKIVSLARVVAHAFLPAHDNELFDTPINLDGNRHACAAANLMWRPRYFARKYHRQFTRLVERNDPVRELETGEPFTRSIYAAVLFGLLAVEISSAAWNYTFQNAVDVTVWPTGQQFESLQKTRYQTL